MSSILSYIISDYEKSNKIDSSFSYNLLIIGLVIQSKVNFTIGSKNIVIFLNKRLVSLIFIN